MCHALGGGPLRAADLVVGGALFRPFRLSSCAIFGMRQGREAECWQNRTEKKAQPTNAVGFKKRLKDPPSRESLRGRGATQTGQKEKFRNRRIAGVEVLALWS